MKALIDGDILCYEIGAASEVGWSGEEDSPSSPPWEYVASLLDSRLQQLCLEAKADSYQIYLTGKNNFRYSIYPLYKANRKDIEKPFHHNNIKVHLIGQYHAHVVDGMEADDALSIAQCQALDRCEETIICTRDKDLRMVPGWHYSWEIGQQPSWGPCYVVDPGYLCLSQGKAKKLNGTGLMWFYAQMLTGDRVDNIPGLPGVGPVKAYNLLQGAETDKEALDIVYDQYHCKYGQEAEEQMELMGRLLWMMREENRMWDIEAP